MIDSDTDEAFSAYGWIHTVSGRQVYPLNMDPADLDITDIAHSLSRVCRFGGHVKGFFSVAWHSVRVSDWVLCNAAENDSTLISLRRTALLHDATEAYLGDVVRPLKKHPDFRFYNEAEDRLAAVIAERFKLTYPFPSIIHEADDAVLRLELVERYQDGRGMGPEDSYDAFMTLWALVGR